MQSVDQIFQEAALSHEADSKQVCSLDRICYIRGLKEILSGLAEELGHYA